MIPSEDSKTKKRSSEESKADGPVNTSGVIKLVETMKLYHNMLVAGEFPPLALDTSTLGEWKCPELGALASHALLKPQDVDFFSAFKPSSKLFVVSYSCKIIGLRFHTVLSLVCSNLF